MATSEFVDQEFGTIQVHRVRGRSSISLRITPAGMLRITMPPLTPLFMAKKLLETSRNSIREHFAQTQRLVFYDGMQIGKSHTLRVRSGSALHISRVDRSLHVTIPAGSLLEDTDIQAAIRAKVIPLLRREAKHYLPKRLEYLARQHNFRYTTVRFSHASSRWGSCSSNGTISLNIALMNLPFELIDYVLLHELCHTVHMNHSSNFWELVEQCDPQYKLHRKTIKTHTPAI